MLPSAWARPCGSSISRFPGRFLDFQKVSDEARKNKKIIAESVKVFDDKIAVSASLLEAYTTTFRPPADAPCNVQMRNRGMAPGQNEIFHFRERLVHAIDFIFQQPHILFAKVRDFHL